MTSIFMSALHLCQLLLCQISRYPARSLVVCFLVLALLDINPLKGMLPWVGTRKPYSLQAEVQTGRSVSATFRDIQRRTLNVDDLPKWSGASMLEKFDQSNILRAIRPKSQKYQIIRSHALFQVTQTPNMASIIHLQLRDEKGRNNLHGIGLNVNDKNKNMNIKIGDTGVSAAGSKLADSRSSISKSERLQSPMGKVTINLNSSSSIENPENVTIRTHPIEEKKHDTDNSHGNMPSSINSERQTDNTQQMADQISPRRDVTRSDAFLQDYARRCQSRDQTRDPDDGVRLCPCVPPDLEFKLQISMENVSLDELKAFHPELPFDGHYKPRDCHSRQRLAVIIPFRDREEHLSILLRTLHRLLQIQRLEYRIFVIEQTRTGVFNKALLMNAGFLESRRAWPYDCVVFHDVDMLPEDGRNMYACLDRPRHLGAYVDKFDYKLPYEGLFGGAIALSPAQFEKVNGFSNKYYGWGGEDDDMYHRITTNGLEVERFPEHIARYTMIQHGPDKGNPLGRKRSKAWQLGPDEYLTDGLTSVRYTVVTTAYRQLYTWLVIEPACHLSKKAAHGFSRAAVMRSYFLELNGCRHACESEARCVAITWHFSSSQCKLHQEVAKPEAAPFYLHFIKACNK